ncbi:hypothetical protein GGR57DRAFT_376857 [Xylariaceae sp. FL1272]|nr:hypothetical protein GGR57DRAFT_376857 [Xylariaceae sp. FL1272]
MPGNHHYHQCGRHPGRITPPCIGTRGFNQVDVEAPEAIGLSFTNFTGGINVSVTDNPQLQIPQFSTLSALENLVLDQLPALTQVSLPKLAAGAETLVYPVTYTFTPSISITNALKFGGLSLPSLIALGNLVIQHVPRRRTESGGLSNITTALSILSDNYLSYPGLRSVDNLTLIGYEGCEFSLPNLDFVGDFRFSNALDSQLQTPALTINGSFSLDTIRYDRAANETAFEV